MDDETIVIKRQNVIMVSLQLDVDFTVLTNETQLSLIPVLKSYTLGNRLFLF